MPNMQKNIQVQTVDPVSASRRAALPMAVSLPPPLPVEAADPSTLSTDLPTIQTLLGPGISRTVADGIRRQAKARRDVQAEREASEALLNHSPEWMAAIGRIGGLSKSPAKSRAARLNGAKGGRPRKTDPLTDATGDAPHQVAHVSPGHSLPAPRASRASSNEAA